jgi:hypothetical protein
VIPEPPKTLDNRLFNHFNGDSDHDVLIMTEVHVTSPNWAMAEVAKTNEQGGVLYDPKIETSHRKNRYPKLVK